MYANVQKFIDRINEDCGFNEPSEIEFKQSIENLNEMTADELKLLDDVLAIGPDDMFMGDLFLICDGDEPSQPVPPIVQGAYEWLVGPFIVTHPEYDRFWWRHNAN